MRGTRLPAVALIVALAAVSVAAVIVIDPIGSVGPSSSPAPRTPGTSASPVPELALLDIEDAQGGPPFAIEGGAAPTSDSAQSKLWFHDGGWWGVLVAEGSDQFRIHRFDWGGGRWIDTGVPVTTRASVQPDVIAEDGLLWIATGGGQPTPRRTAALFRYTYDADDGQYVLDADFPVTIADEQARGLTMARDAAGRLWAAWISQDRLVVSHTTTNDWTWAAGSVPEVPGADGITDAVALVGYGETVALLWTNEDADTLSLATPRVDDVVAWQHSSIAVDGLAPGDDHLDATAVETGAGPRIFVAVETSHDQLAGRSQGDPQLLLIAIEPDRSSHQYLVGRISDGHARPIVLVDGENEVIYVMATTPESGGAIVTKASSMIDISFPTGTGVPLIALDELASLTDATSTKQTLSSATGLVVLASDSVAGSYAWVAATLPGADAPSAATVPDPAPNEAPLLVATFDPFVPGSTLDPMWAVRATGAATFEIADLDGRRVAKVTAAPDGSSARMCRDIAPQSSGVVRIEVDVMLSRVGLSDATITAARHDDAQTAVVRLDDSAVFSFFDGSAQVRSEVRWQAGMWYTSVVLLDLDDGTYDWRVTRISDGATVFGVDGARWRTAASGPMTEVCLESPQATNPATVFAVDRVLVDLPG